ncbi:MAG: adenylate/guanylate cyclase domain-containing protein [Mariprofundaceae bacterium]|nr:adenylate/guanylate cyclase domain-containing protein [Mariprofundaceae bacterium]
MAKTPFEEQIGLSLRLRWTLIVGGLMGSIVLSLTLVILDLEKNAWETNQSEQSMMLVNRLGDELKIPMLSDSQSEVELLVDSFLQGVSYAQSIELYWAGRGTRHYGNNSPLPNNAKHLHLTEKSIRIDPNSLWYMRSIYSGSIPTSTIAIQFSAEAWNQIAKQIKIRLFIAAVIIIFISSIVIYWVAGRMSHRIELLAKAAQHVANDDFSIRLAVQGKDEISVTTRLFNRMVSQLAHKEHIREEFSRYLNPKLISKLFAEEGGIPESHDQQVTVLFADMVSFTSYSQSAPAATVINALNEHFEVFHHIIDAFGGNVDKYIGDAVMAVFNHPFEDEDHTRHAVMAGLCMVEACKRLAIERPDGEHIQFRIGLDQGDVIVGNIGARKRLEYTVIGNTVNVASRMAGLGLGIIASKRVFTDLPYGFEMNDMGSQAIKGIDKPIHCVQIVAASRKLKNEITKAVDMAFEAKENASYEDKYDDDYNQSVLLKE